MSSDQSNEITVTLSPELWKALLDVVPPSSMTYTPEGETIFAAYQAVSQALGQKVSR